MSEIGFVILIRGMLTFLLVYGALRIARYGFWLYRNGHGNKRDQLVFEWHELKVTARTAGAVLMSTSFMWAGLAVYAAPKSYERSADGAIKLTDAGYELKTAPITICSNTPFTSLKSDLKALEGTFRKAIEEYNSSELGFLVFDGKSANYESDSVSIKPAGDNKYLLEADVRREGTLLGKVQFTAEGKGHRITFRPSSLRSVVSPNEDPNSLQLQGANKQPSSRTPTPRPSPGENDDSNQSRPKP